MDPSWLSDIFIATRGHDSDFTILSEKADAIHLVGPLPLLMLCRGNAKRQTGKLTKKRRQTKSVKGEEKRVYQGLKRSHHADKVEMAVANPDTSKISRHFLLALSKPPNKRM